ncbi:hypothetical protein MLD38_001960 [Melastoma candidum]|uniref:Uncharacterized protein n=1 Tax=Melastoma candidum TaxID=119954 RepID=A0ACB9SEW5_9MYRT|nr:hypothetical protein MLD38_001960 [Melastoma candidum]
MPFIKASITVKRYPAEMLLSSLICLVGAVQSTAVALVAEHHPAAWKVGWDSLLLAPLFILSGITYYVQGLVMKSRGPVFITAFNPLCMFIVTILASVILSEKLYLSSPRNFTLEGTGISSQTTIAPSKSHEKP